MKTNLFRDPRHRLRNGWKVLAFALATVLAVVALGALMRALPAGVKAFVPGPLPITLAAVLISWGALRLEGRRLADIGLRLDGRFLREWLAGGLAGAALIGITAALVMGADGFHWIGAPRPSFDAETKVVFEFFCVAIFEELVIRGYPLQRAIRGLGTGWAVGLFALLFAALHLPGNLGYGGPLLATAMLNIFAAGVMLSLCYLRTGSLALQIGLHFGWNLTQESLGFGVSGIATHGWLQPVYHHRSDWLTGGAFGLEASVFALVTVGAVILWLARRPSLTPRLASLAR